MIHFINDVEKNIVDYGGGNHSCHTWRNDARHDVCRTIYNRTVDSLIR